jgi:NADH dehydrogenase [ubiquinone] 1 alpha subcomplex assembly factor 3
MHVAHLIANYLTLASFRSVLSWNIEHYEHINEQSLSIFHVHEPKVDLLVLGIGDQKPSLGFQRTILSYMKKYNINVEVLHTEQACATFNFLNAEGRMVAGALIPPATLSVGEDDYARFMIERQNMLSLE